MVYNWMMTREEEEGNRIEKKAEAKRNEMKRRENQGGRKWIPSEMSMADLSVTLRFRKRMSSTWGGATVIRPNHNQIVIKS